MNEPFHEELVDVPCLEKKQGFWISPRFAEFFPSTELCQLEKDAMTSVEIENQNEFHLSFDEMRLDCSRTFAQIDIGFS